MCEHESISSYKCCKYLLVGDISFTLNIVSWWIAVLNFSEVKYINHLFEFVKIISSFFSERFKTVYYIFNPGSIWNCSLSIVYSRKVFQVPPPDINIQLSVDKFSTDPMIYKTTFVLYPNYINGGIQFPDFPLFPKRQYSVLT